MSTNKRTFPTIFSIVSLFSLLFAFTACNETGTPKEEAEDVRQEFAEFVQAVEKSADERMDQNMSELEAEYRDICQRVDEQMTDIGQATKRDIDSLEKRPQNAKNRIDMALNEAKEQLNDASDGVQDAASEVKENLSGEDDNM